MPFPIYVDGYPGCPANERPKQFTLDEDIHKIAAVEVKRLHGDVELFQVRTIDSKRYLSRISRQASATALGKIGDEVAIPHLLNALYDNNSDVRIAAGKALVKVGDNTIITALVEALDSERNEVCMILLAILMSINRAPNH